MNARLFLRQGSQPPLLTHYSRPSLTISHSRLHPSRPSLRRVVTFDPPSPSRPPVNRLLLRNSGSVESAAQTLADFCPPKPRSRWHFEFADKEEIRRRFRDRKFYRDLWDYLKDLIIPITVFHVLLIGTGITVHIAKIRYEDTINPTTDEWRVYTRYCVLRSRLTNPLFSWMGPQSDDDTEWWLNEAMIEVMREVRLYNNMEDVTDEFRREVIKIRLARADFYRRKRLDYDKEQEELEEALKIPLKPEAGIVSERVQAAARLASICEWNDDTEGVFKALKMAVALAWPEAVGEDGTVSIPPPLPPVGSQAVTNELLDAFQELSVYLARHGEIAPALETMTQILVRRQAGPKIFDPTVPGAAKKISDPCKQATVMASIGELMFALGKRNEGIAWEQKAWEMSRWLADMRIQCNKCSYVAADNLVKMGEIIRDEGLGSEKKKSKGWLWTKDDKDFDPEDGALLAEEFKEELKILSKIRVVKDQVFSSREENE